MIPEFRRSSRLLATAFRPFDAKGTIRRVDGVIWVRYSRYRRPSAAWNGDGSITPAFATGWPGTGSSAPRAGLGHTNGVSFGVYGPMTLSAVATPIHR